MAARTVLVVDRSAATRVARRQLLEGAGHRVLDAADVATAVMLAESEVLDLVLVGEPADDPDAARLPEALRRRAPTVGCLLLDDATPTRLALAVDLALDAHEQREQLRVAERLKTELLGSVSHELRTPLNVILGYLDLLRDGTFGACTPEAHEVLDRLRANGGYLLELLEEFLDLTRLEAGVARVRRDRVDLGPLLHELGESFTLLVREKPVVFRTTIPSSLPLVAADGAKLRVILQNLLANAAKFTAAGYIQLGAVTSPGSVAVQVSDTGPGIPAEHQEAIFELFHQLEPEARASRGIGLGLALARRFARMMGGDVTVTSTPGSGATFTVTLPLAPDADRTLGTEVAA
jgi:signal transduction histidine kinase